MLVVLVPELLFITLRDVLEELIAVGASLSERKLPGDHRKEKDSDGKKVCRRTPVAIITLDYLRSHVLLCAYDAFL